MRVSTIAHSLVLSLLFASLCNAQNALIDQTQLLQSKNQVFNADEGLSLNDIWASGAYYPRSVRGVRSMKDGIHYSSFYLDRDSREIMVLKYSYESGEVVDTILKESWLKFPGTDSTISIDDYEFSSDEKKIMISSDTEPIYRRSSKATNYIFDRTTKTVTPLSDKGKQMYATFSPSGAKVAFVRDNNIFLTDLESNQEKVIADGGKYNEIINGAADWVYEEEFSFAKAFFWAPDGSSIAYYVFDERKVKEFSMAMYQNRLYPLEYKFKYPKAGEDNSVVKVKVFHLDNSSTVDIPVGSENDQYIPRLKWTKDPGTLMVYRMNRHQSKLELMLADVKTGSSKVILTETNDAYIDITDDIRFLNDKKHFIWTSEKSGYNHIYLYDLTGKLVRQITDGKWDVTEFLGLNEETQMLYYISAEVSPLERHLYSIKIDGKGKKQLTKRKGWNSISPSKGFNYYINYHSDANSPTYVTLHTGDGKEKRVLEDNEALKKRLAKLNLPKKEFFNFKTTEGVMLNGWMIKPKGFDSKKNYPVLIHVYGGPGSQTVQDQWGRNFLWHQLMAQEGYIIVSIDNRGTGARGEKFKKITYKELGKYETIDQIEGAKYLGKLDYVDKNRIGIWGWSYGGYMSSLCLTKGAKFFKAAIAVAPVTTWRYYDSIYTERYMQTPQENPNGYDDNSPINHVEKLEGKYLLVHGAADDNVHYQNSIEMINALVKANKQFDLYIYPDRNHGIYGGNTRLHLFTKITNFIKENL